MDATLSNKVLQIPWHSNDKSVTFNAAIQSALVLNVIVAFWQAPTSIGGLVGVGTVVIALEDATWPALEEAAWLVLVGVTLVGG